MNTFSNIHAKWGGVHNFYSCFNGHKELRDGKDGGNEKFSEKFCKRRWQGNIILENWALAYV
jgi:hypothetical protein